MRRPSYEIFLRIHQILAVLSLYWNWRHLPFNTLLPRLYIYIVSAIFLAPLLWQCLILLHRNGIIVRDFPTARITEIEPAIIITITLSREISVRAGQYIELWLFGSWSFFQSHPFVVTSWDVGKSKEITLHVLPRRGLTRQLRMEKNTTRKVLIGGPYGISASTSNYENILILATDFGMAACFAYLQQMIYEYTVLNVRNRRLHVYWHTSLGERDSRTEPVAFRLKFLDIIISMQEELNRIIDKDGKDKV